ncbi:MAG: hypothetical protein RIG84_03130 [Roseovarius sp.]
MNPRWLFRMARWAQNPPSEKRVIFVLAIVALCIALFVVERYMGWPDWATMEPRGWKYRP